MPTCLTQSTYPLKLINYLIFTKILNDMLMYIQTTNSLYTNQYISLSEIYYTFTRYIASYIAPPTQYNLEI